MMAGMRGAMGFSRGKIVGSFAARTKSKISCP
jgi:hypothetical protein